jgi:hypothetical protein
MHDTLAKLSISAKSSLAKHKVVILSVAKDLLLILLSPRDKAYSRSFAALRMTGLKN